MPQMARTSIQVWCKFSLQRPVNHQIPSVQCGSIEYLGLRYRETISEYVQSLLYRTVIYLLQLMHIDCS